MDSVIRDFLDKLTLTLNYENERRSSNGTPFLDVAFMVSPVEQHIAEFEEFVRFLSEGEYNISYFPGDHACSNGEAHVFRGADSRTTYVIHFTFDERMWGYCQCSPEHEGYNPKHRCCGNGCDWTAPSFSMQKVVDMGRAFWSGSESDYWPYEEAFNAKLAIANAELTRVENERRATWLRAEITRLQEQLAEVQRA